MNRTTLAAVLLLASTALATLPAQADVILDTHGQGGTGDNVVFSSFNGPLGLVLGTLNGQHEEIVRFRDLSGNSGFAGFGGTSGNDIKIVNTSDLDITVFDRTDTTQITTTRDIFSLKGSGQAFITVTALEADGSFKDFNFGGFTLSNGQSGFDLQAINGERIFDIDLKIVGGTLTDFEHYRIEVGPTAAVPGPVVGAGLPGLAAVAMFGLNFWRRRRNGASLPA
jgi:hypothetical protein